MGDTEQLCLRHSFYTALSDKLLSHNYCKSDINFPRQKHLPNKQYEVRNLQSFCDYYKKYEHDVLPVKDSTYHDTSYSDENRSLTNSDLDKLEMSVIRKMSQELQTDNNDNNSSKSSLESNIKFFKTTVQEIFDNFYASMRDFELYKKRFHEILAKNQEEAVADMEDFIKDMIHHIMSSQSSIANENTEAFEDSKENDEESIISSIDGNNKEFFMENPEITIASDSDANAFSENLEPVVKAYKNYITDSTVKDSKSKSDAAKEVLNIYLLSRTPYVKIKMTDRNLLSEINTKEAPNSKAVGKYVTSAENVRRPAAKKELEKFKQEQNYDVDPDREIPVKVSYAKRNIHLNEESTHEIESEKSFLAKLCHFLCKNFRKS